MVFTLNSHHSRSSGYGRWHATTARGILGRDSLARLLRVTLELVELAEEDALAAGVVGAGLVPGVVHGRVPGAVAGARRVARVRGGLRTATTCVSCARAPARGDGGELWDDKGGARRRRGWGEMARMRWGEAAKWLGEGG